MIKNLPNRINRTLYFTPAVSPAERLHPAANRRSLAVCPRAEAQSTRSPQSNLSSILILLLSGDVFHRGVSAALQHVPRRKHQNQTSPANSLARRGRFPLPLTSSTSYFAL